MTTPMQRRRGHTGDVFYNYRGDAHGRHKTGRPRPGQRRPRYEGAAWAWAALAEAGIPARRRRRE